MTFIEILFAVIIMGVGLIMIAAVFPVALQQTQSTVDETTASVLARNAINYLTYANFESLFTSQGLVPAYTDPSSNYTPSPPSPLTPPQMMSFYDGDTNQIAVASAKRTLGEGPPSSVPLHYLWSTVRGNLISTSDPRFAWVGFYSWSGDNPIAKFVIVVVRARTKSNYVEGPSNFANYPSATGWSDVVRQSSGTPATLEGNFVNFSIFMDPGGTASSPLYDVTFSNIQSNNTFIAPMAYLVVQSESTNTINGYVFRIGNPVSSTTWQLIPGDDLADSPVSGSSFSSCTGYVVGKEVDPNSGQYAGPAQDIAAYTTFVYMN